MRYGAFPLRRFETWAQRDFSSKITIPTVAVANVESMIPQAIDLLFEIFKLDGPSKKGYQSVA
jgi:hypothetical protein